MTKRNKILVSVLCACVAALLVAVCCLGFTFARYTATESETASVGIAKWDISLAESTNVQDETVTFSGIKPSADAYEQTARTNDTLLYVGTLTNSGDVSATVTVNDVNLSFAEDSTPDSTTYSITDVNNHIKIDVLYSSSSDNETVATNLTKLSNVTLSTNDSIYIYFDVVWTSDLDDDSTPGTDGDTFDTWMAENVVTLTATVTLDVVQAADAT